MRHGILGVAIASCLLLPAFTWAAPGIPASPRPSVSAEDAQALCATALRIRKQHSTDLSRVASAGIVMLSGRGFAFRDDSWKAFTASDPTVSQYFHSSAWLIPLYDDDSTLAIDLLLEQAAASADPGGGAGRDSLRRTGWAEYHVTLRLWAGLCLYARSSDARILSVLDALIAANLDESRYYGPPRRPPHTHGVFANEALRAAGELLGRPDLVARASLRLHDMFQGVFDPCGMVREQSSFYQALNIRIWTRNLGPGMSEEDRAVLQRARSALAALIRPDGVLQPIGDGVLGAWSAADLAALGVSSGGSVFCPDTGWAAVHRAPPAGRPQHHIVRFGPAPRMHGHADHGAATWWVGPAPGDGLPVLADRGLFDNSADARRRWADSPQAHSVLRLQGEDFIGRTAGEQLSADGVDAYRLVTSKRRGTATRVLTFVRDSFVLGSADTFRVASGPAARPVQSWHLDPGWVPSSAHTAVTRDGAHTLDIFCLVQDAVIAPALVPVEHFAGYRTPVGALEARCGAPRGRDIRFETIIAVDLPDARVRVVDGHLTLETASTSYAFAPDGLLAPRPASRGVAQSLG